MYRDLLEKYVVVRSSPSGVWLGTLDHVEGDTVRLRQARRAWSWQGAASCSGLATHGPSGGKITPPVDIAVILSACEVLAATDAAVARWDDVSPWIAQ